MKALRSRIGSRFKGQLPELWTAAPLGIRPDPRKHKKHTPHHKH